MYLKHISLTNFRNFTRLDIDIPQRVVLLTGANAQGKTSVLEAIYFLAAFTSFQTHTDRQLINFIEGKKNSLAVARLVAEYQRGKSRHRMEARLILAAVAQHYKFSLEPDELIRPVQLVTLRPSSPVRMKIGRRDGSSLARSQV